MFIIAESMSVLVVLLAACCSVLAQVLVPGSKYRPHREIHTMACWAGNSIGKAFPLRKSPQTTRAKSILSHSRPSVLMAVRAPSQICVILS